ncbi:cysteine desulfurase family protein [Microbacterium imperiale]|uniref:Cysteine desulfurase n=1 Tax=Microbacterium imperiale TaxID=33884 RepID=A0A9W6HFH7_9MICO|nr:cysteine desulfurase family protein [Microbacterium imperiale]MBP2419296.1 cysteine desulfurase [Microbacterium imperiale]MDS0198833.1 cysteine desulfurase [Microbacterium imperiale]BFE39638.1 cysteine desulfurase family protein [Microbacterium imperiale]GLJ79387.1 cysteine desulfurase [Microbacterium imperiale]
MLYLDHAAGGPVRPEVLDAMAPFLLGRYGNPSSVHTVGEDVSAALEDARRRIAAVLGMRAGDVVFTSGGTEANNLAIAGIALGARGRRPGHVITTAIEHSSVLAVCRYLERMHDYDLDILPVDAHGRVRPADIAAAVRVDTAVISIGYANNEIGTVQDLAAVAAAAGGIPLHVDAVQAAGWLPLSGTGAAALSIAGHKLGAPQGIGALAVRGRLPLEPLLHGGGQERGRRAGTQNVAGAVGLAVALELAEHERADAASRATAARRAFTDRVLATIPGSRLTGDAVDRLPGLASFVFVGTSGEAVLLELERRGIVTSSGSACSAGSTDASHVLTAIGLNEDEARTAVRFSFDRSEPPTPAVLADALGAAVAAVRSAA